MADTFGVGTAIAGGLNFAGNMMTTYMNNIYGAQREEQARQENYIYNERSAENADARTRALYNDLYSPKAQMQQIKDAGLSPSVFYGDMNGIAGQTGAQGTGAAGIAPVTYGIPAMDLANIGLIAAQTRNTYAQAELAKSQTQQTDLENKVKELETTSYAQEWKIINSYLQDDNGNTNSLYEFAHLSENYEQFLKQVREIGLNSDPELRLATETENGQKTLRAIYEASKKFGKDLAVLANEKINAEFYEKVTDTLSKTNYANLNAKAITSELKMDAEESQLSERQTEAFNNLINKLDSKNSTATDVFIALLLMINNALKNYKIPSKKTFNINNTLKGGGGG